MDKNLLSLDTRLGKTYARGKYHILCNVMVHHNSTPVALCGKHLAPRNTIVGIRDVASSELDICGSCYFQVYKKLNMQTRKTNIGERLIEILKDTDPSGVLAVSLRATGVC